MYINSFNSNLVRLRVGVRNQVAQIIIRFQFQSGAIKRIDSQEGDYLNFAFQFQSGAIKSAVLNNVQQVIVWFQFQSGAIKRTFLFHPCLLPDSFQFQSGAIKSMIFCDPHIDGMKVSIPIWCD